MEFKELIEKRRSVREYIEKEIDDNLIYEAISCATNAPSWKNSQTARYYLVSSNEMLEKVKACMPQRNQENSKNAKIVVTTFVKNRSGFNKETGMPDNEAGNGWGFYDLGLHNSYFILALKDLGLDSLIMGLRDEKQLREVLDINENEIITSIIAVGYTNIEIIKPKKKAVIDITKTF